MKLTKKQIIKIIKEEIDAVVNESEGMMGVMDDVSFRLNDRMVKMNAVTDALKALSSEIEEDRDRNLDADVYYYVGRLLEACDYFYNTFKYVIAGYRADSAEYLKLQEAYRKFLRVFDDDFKRSGDLKYLKDRYPKQYESLMADLPEGGNFKDVIDAVKADVDLPSQPDTPEDPDTPDGFYTRSGPDVPDGFIS